MKKNHQNSVFKSEAFKASDGVTLEWWLTSSQCLRDSPFPRRSTSCAKPLRCLDHPIFVFFDHMIWSPKKNIWTKQILKNSVCLGTPVLTDAQTNVAHLSHYRNPSTWDLGLAFSRTIFFWVFVGAKNDWQVLFQKLIKWLESRIKLESWPLPNPWAARPRLGLEARWVWAPPPNDWWKRRTTAPGRHQRCPFLGSHPRTIKKTSGHFMEMWFKKTWSFSSLKLPTKRLPKMEQLPTKNGKQLAQAAHAAFSCTAWLSHRTRKE